MKHFSLILFVLATLISCQSEDPSLPLPISDATVIIHPDYGQGTRSADCPFEVIFEPELRLLCFHFFPETISVDIHICHDNKPVEAFVGIDSPVYTIPISGEPGIWTVLVDVEGVEYSVHFFSDSEHSTNRFFGF